MYIGQPSGGKDFFKLLMESEEFCSELGQATLSAGKLEVELMLLLKRKNVISEIGQHTLGTLIKKAKDEGILDNNLIISLEFLNGVITRVIYLLPLGTCRKP